MKDSYTFSDFPMEIELMYTDRPGSLSRFILYLAEPLSFLIGIAGVLSLLFRPDRIRISSTGGMNLIQFIQIYPTALITLSISLFSVFYMLKSYLTHKTNEKINKAVNEKIGFLDGKIPEGTELKVSLTKVIGNEMTFNIHLVTSNPDRNPTK